MLNSAPIKSAQCIPSSLAFQGTPWKVRLHISKDTGQAWRGRPEGEDPVLLFTDHPLPSRYQSTKMWYDMRRKWTCRTHPMRRCDATGHTLWGSSVGSTSLLFGWQRSGLPLSSVPYAATWRDPCQVYPMRRLEGEGRQAQEVPPYGVDIKAM